MQQDDRLLLGPRRRRVFQKFLRPANGLGQQDDGAALIVLDREGHIIFDAEHGFVACGDRIAEADFFGRGRDPQHGGHAARLANDIDLQIRRQRRGRADERERDLKAVDEIGIAKAIRPGEGDIVPERDVGQTLLRGEAARAHFREAGSETHDAAELLGREIFDRIDDAGSRQRQNRQIYPVRQIGHRSNGLAAVELGEAAADEMDLALVAHIVERRDAVAARAAGPLRDADDRDRFRPKKPRDLRPRNRPRGLICCHGRTCRDRDDIPSYRGNSSARDRGCFPCRSSAGPSSGRAAIRSPDPNPSNST